MKISLQLSSRDALLSRRDLAPLFPGAGDYTRRFGRARASGYAISLKRSLRDLVMRPLTVIALGILSNSGFGPGLGARSWPQPRPRAVDILGQEGRPRRRGSSGPAETPPLWTPPPPPPPPPLG
jgi:hypothetical protein